MSLTPLGWLLVASSITLSALLVFSLRLDAAALALVSRLRASSWGFGQGRRGTAATLIVAAAVFLLVAGIGAAASFLGSSSDATADRIAQAHSGSNSDTVARLKDYTRSLGSEEPAPAAAPGKLLPDVNTMIERLAARLESAPGDAKGWRTLGWSYFNTGRYKQAAAAYAKAAELDPSSAEIKASYDEAKAKASESENAEPASSSPTQEGVNAAIRSMVDGLAARLESSPEDVEGWTRLMRSRVVLGERDVAATALRKALDIFKNDPEATGKITAAATELGLKNE